MRPIDWAWTAALAVWYLVGIYAALAVAAEIRDLRRSDRIRAAQDAERERYRNATIHLWEAGRTACCEHVPAGDLVSRNPADVTCPRFRAENRAAR